MGVDRKSESTSTLDIKIDLDRLYHRQKPMTLAIIPSLERINHDEVIITISVTSSNRRGALHQCCSMSRG